MGIQSLLEHLLAAFRFYCNLVRELSNWRSWRSSSTRHFLALTLGFADE